MPQKATRVIDTQQFPESTKELHMANPYKCPVCNGTGLVSRPPGVAGDQEAWTSTSVGPWPCRSCENGIVWEATTEEAEPMGLTGTTGLANTRQDYYR